MNQSTVLAYDNTCTSNHHNNGGRRTSTSSANPNNDNSISSSNDSMGDNLHHKNHSDNNNNNNNNNHYDTHHPRSSKRRCSGPTGNSNGSAQSALNSCSSSSSADCFDQVTAVDNAWTLKQVRHDWFHEIPCIRKSATATTTTFFDSQQQFQQQQQEEKELQQLQSEIQSLDYQLSQVKRRFHVASERCAQAVNQTNTFTTTTASYEFEQARRACNPFEILGETRPGGLNHGLFLNRSAIKLANMDAQLNFSLLNNHTDNHNHHHHHQEQQQQQCHQNSINNKTFHFADLCAAPGGFSEYLLRRFCSSLSNGGGGRKQHHHYTLVYTSCRGYGMSLVGDNDQGHGCGWKITQGPLLIGNRHNNKNNSGGVFYHISRGEDGTGDIFQWRNVQSLQREIAAQQYNLHNTTPPLATTTTTSRGHVALVLADGGVDAQRNVEHPEAITQKLVVCEVAAALSLLEPGGRLVLKLLGCQTTPVLQCVLQELYDSFEQLQILKPISSRPASGERYLVCTGFLGCPSFQTASLGATTTTTSAVAFDGPRWINRVLLGQFTIAPALATFLARVDRDMLTLNLKACFAILSHLESKTMQLTSSLAGMKPISTSTNGSGDQMEEDDEDEQWIAQGYQSYQQEHQDGNGGAGKHSKVKVEDYRRAWRLF